jgi:hypothetical protein
VSAYVVATPHINALVRLALEGPIGVPVDPGNTWHSIYFGDGRLTPDRADELGQALLRENLRSVNYRYSEHRRRPAYKYNGGRQLTVPEAILAISGYHYQACEHPGWERSEVYRFLFRLLDAVASRVPGVSEATTWEVTSDAREVA